ncbi:MULTISPECIES: glycoside hydrolase family 76 protein [Leptolyngbya]|jgi:predicted alpha-1,6-mannanase (GH76 family)|uniref:Coagulation factor 5/8 type domain protein n=2 Tax=Leptolyngbya boryana TaxID=1184 RepID=A0A1Z4JPC4_LEPBY|nr:MULTISPECIES: glycoside hydrolase family 76 protein [Leptolyngbya]BAY58625.1 coagulation factor 5/8 type domain protein [Leptolyngbya boryana NIES-2135]MCY6489439.1 glycoside hydrolase family 76 protein [Leptolyngbya sp. GGD]ULP29687.1 glycoside hydrolase family 76 protein [Leptolyngbya boryana IU 594]WNZ47978.1 glycoside hydrolase family 76 protein [Leptolyngbya boryana CZ1]BAS55232.1 coagulation factor 5/8 type domain protein [Leptolyngbya boryana IAM M-101]
MVLPGACHATAAAGMAALQVFYSSTTGLWNSTGWWNAANALETTIDYSRLTKQKKYHPIIVNTYEKHKSQGFLEANVYDDQGWWALTWIKAYDLTGEKRYLDTAKSIFKDMTKGWDSKCGGGMWWRKDRQYKNAITNGLFFTIAIRLHQRTVNDYGKGSYIDWAKHGWNWFKKSGMINKQNLVNDGLNDHCRNNGDVTWTYNQGVVMGGLVDFYKSTKDQTYLKQAHAIATATIKHLSRKGILIEYCEPECGDDGPQFKGIFMRNLAYLQETSPKAQYKAFILKNADTVWAKRNQRDQFGLSWSKKFDSADAARQSSAIDALNAAIPLKDPACVVERVPPTRQSRLEDKNQSFYPLFSMQVNATDQISFEVPNLFSLIDQLDLPFDLFSVQENS